MCLNNIIMIELSDYIHYDKCVDDKTFKILSIDGGGVKLLYSLYLLDEIEKFYCHDNNTTLKDHFDMICGTSMASAIAILISKGYKIKEIIHIFEENIVKIFPNSLLTRFYHNILQLFGSKYNFNLTLLNKYIGEELFDSKNYFNYICVPSYNITKNEIVVFKNYDVTHKLKTKDVILSTCSAPTYFPPYKIETQHYIDGAIWSNNPSLIGFCEAKQIMSSHMDLYDKCAILSIGNYVSTKKIIPKNPYFWNLFNIQLLISTILDSNEFATNNILKSLCSVSNDIYIRIDHKECIVSSIDDVSNNNLTDLKECGINDGVHIILKQQDEHIQKHIDIGQFFLNNLYPIVKGNK